MVKDVELRWQRVQGRAAAEETDDALDPDQTPMTVETDDDPDLAQILETERDPKEDEILKMKLLAQKRGKVDGIGRDLILDLEEMIMIIVDLSLKENTIEGVDLLVMIPGIDK